MNKEEKFDYELLVKHILKQINMCLCDYITQNTDNRLISYGLYNGKFGLLLYLATYNKYYPDDKTGKVIDLFADRLISEWSENPYNYTYCSGISGILDMFSYMNEKQIYPVDLKDVLPSLENYIANRMIDDMERGKYDFLHEALGAAYCLIEKESKLKHIEKFIFLLEKCAEKECDGIYKWKFFDITDNRFKYNIGLAHGMSSIVVFLSEAYKRGICRENVESLLLSTLAFILAQKFKNKNSNLSMFPHLSKEDDGKESRLGWCYGDLGIAIALWKAGNSLNIDEYRNIAVNIVENSMKRMDLNANMVIDAGICHGTSGIAMMFQYYFEEMKLNKASVLRDYWFLETIKMICSDNNDIDILTMCKNGEYSLLTGISGIGLVLLSSITQDFSWKKLFLLR
jgi:lantibiotic modifying enzyme